MDRLYNVTIEYLGLKKRDRFELSTICLGKDGAFLVMDHKGKAVRFVANDCKVEQIAAHVIILRGYTDKPHSITAYCIYANAPVSGGTPSAQVSCSACGGTGQDDPPPGKYHGICPVCKGTGLNPNNKESENEKMEVQECGER